MNWDMTDDRISARPRLPANVGDLVVHFLSSGTIFPKSVANLIASMAKVRVLDVEELSNGAVGIFSADKDEAEVEDFLDLDIVRHCKCEQKLFVMIRSVWVVVDIFNGLVA
ncbi:hypothetical protein TNCV_2042731 [Trichonephila clavipes]|nr:hypothetical protein TNCV_2042731 [Trichonephila clavipes]